MPNYNKAEFISEAVDSVVKQSYKNWYLYIIDGGSTDLSLQKLSKFSKIKKFHYPKYNFDYVRSGLALYGINPLGSININLN